MIFLDTHVVVWLYSGLVKKLSAPAGLAIEENEIIISQMVRLELQYLYEIDRLTVPADEIIDELKKLIGLKVSKIIPAEIFTNALNLSWTRDVFDRLIVAEAIALDKCLISKDRKIREYFDKVIW